MKGKGDGTTTKAGDPGLGRSLGRWRQFKERGVLMVFVGLCAVFSILTPNFLQVTNLINILRQISEISIAAVGMTYIIIAAEIDLGVGSAYGLSAALAAIILQSGFAGFPVPFAILGALAVGALIGLFNGVITTKLKVPAFIVTLSGLAIARGAVYWVTGGYSVSTFPKSADAFFLIGESIGGVFPIQIVIMIVFGVVSGVILSKTKYGFQVYATGGNKKAADLTGINTDRIKIAAFIFCGLCSALSGLVALAYLTSVHPSAGIGREMDIIAAVVVGGTYLYGGRGTILGTFIGAAIIGVVRNGMVLLSVPAYSQEAFIGLVILLAVISDTLLRKEKR